MTPADGRPAGPPVTFAPAALYPIVDTASADLATVDAILRGVLDAGVPWLQLRCKGAPASSFLAAATDLVRIAGARGARVVVNDRLDVALASGAAGVHLGQDDLPLAAARRLAAGRLAIGISTHDVAEARAACEGGASYVGFGPMFATTSKPDALAPRTLDALAAVRAAIRIPIVAVGGIDEARAGAVLDAGADAVAMIGALASAHDPRALATRLLARRGVTR